MPQAPQSSEIVIPLGGLPGGSRDFKFFGRNVLRVTFLFIPDKDQCVTLTNSNIFVQPMESGTRQRLLNRIAHDIRFDPDFSPAQVNQGDEGFTVWAGLDALAGTLYYWIDHSLSQVSLGDSMCCDDDCGEGGTGPCQNYNVLSTFEDDFQSVIFDGAGSMISNHPWTVTDGVTVEERRNGWIQLIATTAPFTDQILQTVQRSFGPVAAPGRREETRGRVYLSVTIT